jgi:phage baseplate assembly protein W
MASITLKNLEKTGTSTSTYTYTDLHLDVAGVPVGASRDIRADYDLDAIKNSLSNLFNTFPGQKLLNPSYGLNLLQFLHEPITTLTSNLIGQTIIRGIQRYEPRVEVVKVQVNGRVEESEYNITLIIRVPALSQRDTLKLNATLSKNTTFTFL